MTTSGCCLSHVSSLVFGLLTSRATLLGMKMREPGGGNFLRSLVRSKLINVVASKTYLRLLSDPKLLYPSQPSLVRSPWVKSIACLMPNPR